jgi:Flp pilus assembly protein CpaB
MKKNLVPLLGIAFVVAIATTGIFYSLFVGKLGASASHLVVVAAKDLKTGTTLSAELVKVSSVSTGSTPEGAFTSVEQLVGRTLSQAVSEGDPVYAAALVRAVTSSGSLPANHRAVSTHVTDSTGVLDMLHPGDHVDVQVMNVKDHGEGEIRTILQNRVVLAIHTGLDPTSYGAPPAPVVTLLVDKNEAEALALADSTARVRLALRNPNDPEHSLHAGLGFGKLLHEGAPKPDPVALVEAPPAEPASEKPADKTKSATPATSGSSSPAVDVQLQVQVLGAAIGALDELFRPADSAGRADIFQAIAVKRPADLSTVLRNLEQKKTVEVVSTSQVRTGLSSSVSLQAGKQDPHAGVRIRFSPSRTADGRLRLEVEPEVTTPSSVRKLDTRIEVASGQPFLLGGLVQAKERAAVLDKFFGGRELVVIVTPRFN